MKKNSKFSILSFVLLIMIGVGFINLSSYANSYDYSTIPPIAKMSFPALTVTKAMGSGSPKYEAENAIISGGVVYNDTAASNGKGVERIDKAGKYISFSNVTSGSSLVLGYASVLSGKLNIYINDVHATELSFTKSGSWKGAYKEVSVSLRITSGDTIKIQYRRGDSALNLDYIKVNGGAPATSTLAKTTEPDAPATIIIEKE